MSLLKLAGCRLQSALQPVTSITAPAPTCLQDTCGVRGWAERQMVAVTFWRQQRSLPGRITRCHAGHGHPVARVLTSQRHTGIGLQYKRHTGYWLLKVPLCWSWCLN